MQPSGLFLYTFIALVASSTTDKSASIMTFLRELHSRDWQSARPADVRGVGGLQFLEQKVDYPKDSPYRDECGGPLYLISHDSLDGELTVEFRPTRTASGCISELHGVAYHVQLSIADAERLREQVIAELRAGGKPIDGGQDEFVWRSRDSRTRYHLWTSVTSKAKRPRANARKSLELI